LVALDGINAPHPVAKYCITILITLDAAQNRARPLGKDKQRKPNMSGIIHSIIRLCACCFGSAVVGVTIFCCAHIAAPTRMARNILGSAKFNPRNILSKGSVEYTIGQE